MAIFQTRVHNWINSTETLFSEESIGPPGDERKKDYVHRDTNPCSDNNNTSPVNIY